MKLIKYITNFILSIINSITGALNELSKTIVTTTSPKSNGSLLGKLFTRSVLMWILMKLFRPVLRYLLIVIFGNSLFLNLFDFTLDTNWLMDILWKLKSYSLDYIDVVRNWLSGNQTINGFQNHEIQKVNRMREELATANNELAKLKGKSDYNSFHPSDKSKFIPIVDNSYTNFLNDHKGWIAVIAAGLVIALVGFYYPEAFNFWKGDAPDTGDTGGASLPLVEATEARHGSWWRNVTHNPGSVFSRKLDMAGSSLKGDVAVPVTPLDTGISRTSSVNSQDGIAFPLVLSLPFITITMGQWKQRR